MNYASAADRLLAFVRGELEIADLEDIGITADFSSDHVVRVEIAADVDGVMPSSHDVAMGLLRNHVDRASARRWAAAVLAIVDIDLSLLEGDALLEALWDMSAGHEMSADELAAVRALATL